MSDVIYIDLHTLALREDQERSRWTNQPDGVLSSFDDWCDGMIEHIQKYLPKEGET